MKKNNIGSAILNIGVIIFIANILFGIGLNDGFNIGQISGTIIFFVILGIIFKNKNLLKQKDAPKTKKDQDIFQKKEVEMHQHQKPTKNYDSKDLSIKHDYSHRCHKCKTLISSKDKVCPECGAWQSNSIKCSNCGHINPEGNVLCENCNDYLY